MTAVPQIPYIVEGEIISVQPREFYEKTMVHYTVVIDLPLGGDMILFNVRESSSFGGIADYERRRARSREDAEYDDDSVTTENLNASVGERVYVACINGNPFNAVIIAYKQHPNQTEEIRDPSTEDPYYVWQMQGVRKTVDPEGQFRIIHKGAPTVKFSPQIGGALGAALGAASSLVGGVPGDSNPAIEPVSDTNLSAIEMLNEGIVNIRDYSGNLFQIDPSAESIVIQNNKPLDFYDLNKPLIPDISLPSIGINAEAIKITGASDKKIEIQARNEIRLETAQTATLSLSGGKVALGTPAAELLELVIGILDQNLELIKAALDPANQNIGNMGYPTTVAPAKQTAFQQISIEYEKIKQLISSIKGSV